MTPADYALAPLGSGGQFPERSVRATTRVRGAPACRTPPESNLASVEPSWLLQTGSTPFVWAPVLRSRLTSARGSATARWQRMPAGRSAPTGPAGRHREPS